MKLGFYYHISLISTPDGIRLPAYLGVFLDSLAVEADKLVLFMHEAVTAEMEQYDYILKSPNITFFSLGPKTPAWDRFLRPWKTLMRIKNQVNDCDILLVRAPSPLAPAFYKYFGKKTRVAYLIVGDYTEGVKNINQPWWRKLPIQLLLLINDIQLSSVLKKSKTLVNSQKLYNRYKPFVNDLHLVRTTTLSRHDFYQRGDTCMGHEIKLLYTGSFSFEKGLRELINAFAILTGHRVNITLHFVGWDYDPAKATEIYLKNLAEKLGVGKKIFFHGFKTVGPELNEMYRMADIYIIPSYHEGFPRTIWEAMANGLPVIATKVGSIPYYLTDNQDAILIEPKNPEKIIEAVNRLIDDSTLRQRLIKNGYRLAGENTLEVQTSVLVNLLKS